MSGGKPAAAVPAGCPLPRALKEVEYLHRQWAPVRKRPDAPGRAVRPEAFRPAGVGKNNRNSGINVGRGLPHAEQVVYERNLLRPQARRIEGISGAINRAPTKPPVARSHP